MLQIAPSGYRRHAARKRKPELRCARAKRDEALMPQIQAVWQANMLVYGADKVWHQMNREGILHSQKVANPALFRQAFQTLCADPAQEISYTKLLGQLFYWRERNDEVDFVYQYRDQLYAIEVKSGRKKSAKGLSAFCAQVPQALRVIVTPENFEQFSSSPRGFLQRVAV